MVSFNLVAVTIVAALTTSVAAAPIPVYIGAVRVGEKPDNVPRAVLPRNPVYIGAVRVGEKPDNTPRAILPREPVYIGATRNGNAPEYGTRRRELEARHAKNTFALLSLLQTQAAQFLPFLNVVSVADAGDSFHKITTDFQKTIVHETFEVWKWEVSSADGAATLLPLFAAPLKTIGDAFSLMIGKSANTEMGAFSDYNCFVHALDAKVPGIAAMVVDLSVVSFENCVVRN